MHEGLLFQPMESFPIIYAVKKEVCRVRILSFGSMNLDYVYQVDHFVGPGETLSATSQTVNPGGKGLNQSIALARAGAEVWHAGCIGKGGDMLKTLLEENAVATEHLRPVNVLQGNAVIQVAPSGENCILLFGGSNQCVTSAQIDQTLAAFGEGDYLVLQNEINNLPELVEKAHARGMRIFLNPSPFNQKIEAISLKCVDWLLVNEVEACQLSGKDAPERAWEILHDQYPELSLLMTLGGAGSAAYQGDSVYRQSAFPVKAVDTTAAGDTFTGYFIAALAEGRPLPECMRRASMAAAISVTRAGAAPSIPMSEEVNQALMNA